MKSGARLPLLLLLNYYYRGRGCVNLGYAVKHRRPCRSQSPSLRKRKHTKNKPPTRAAEKPQPLPSKIEPPPAASAPEAEPRTEPRKKSAAETADKTPTAPEKRAAEEAKKDPTALSPPPHCPIN